jgi:lysophospholipase L1-like esterase
VKIISRSTLINLSLGIVSIIAALCLCEMTLRILGFKPMYVSPERDRFWKYDPHLGWAHQPGQEGIFETPQFRTTVQINQKGLRDDEHSYERQDNIARILVLGDSFAWGYGVEATERFSEQLEKELDVEVINGGVSGYSTDQELLWYQHEGTKYETDLVILVVAGNDVGDNERLLVSHIYYKPKFILGDGQLILTGSPIPRTGPLGRFTYSLSQKSALAYFLIQRYFDFRSFYANSKANRDPAVPPASAGPKTTEESFRLTTTLLDEIRKMAEANNAKFMIVTTSRWWNHRSEETYQDFLDVLERDGFLVLDVESMPGFDPVEMVIPDDGHWNRSGHRFVAEKIKEFIQEQELLTRP